MEEKANPAELEPLPSPPSRPRSVVRLNSQGPASVGARAAAPLITLEAAVISGTLDRTFNSGLTARAASSPNGGGPGGALAVSTDTEPAARCSPTVHGQAACQPQVAIHHRRPLAPPPGALQQVPEPLARLHPRTAAPAAAHVATCGAGAATVPHARPPALAVEEQEPQLCLDDRWSPKQALRQLVAHADAEQSERERLIWQQQFQQWQQQFVAWQRREEHLGATAPPLAVADPVATLRNAQPRTAASPACATARRAPSPPCISAGAVPGADRGSTTPPSAPSGQSGAALSPTTAAEARHAEQLGIAMSLLHHLHLLQQAERAPQHPQRQQPWQPSDAAQLLALLQAANAQQNQQGIAGAAGQSSGAAAQQQPQACRGAASPLGAHHGGHHHAPKSSPSPPATSAIAATPGGAPKSSGGARPAGTPPTLANWLGAGPASTMSSS